MIFSVCVCPFLSTVSLSVWIRKLRDSIVTERQRERERVTQTANGRGGGRETKNFIILLYRSLFLLILPSVLVSV